MTTNTETICAFDSNVSMEAFSFNEFKGKLTKIVSKAETFFKDQDIDFLTDKEGYITTPPNVINITVAKKYDYSELRERNVVIPLGLKVTYKEYGELLLESAKVCKNIKENVISPYLRWLAIHISDPSKITSARGTGIRDFKPNDVEAYYEAFGKMFKKGSSDDTGAFGNYFRRNQELSEVGVINNQISELLTSVERNSVLNSINELTYLLEKIYDVFLEMDEDEISGAAAITLAKLTYTVAKEVEFMGLVYANFRAYNHAFSTTLKNLK